MCATVWFFSYATWGALPGGFAVFSSSSSRVQTNTAYTYATSHIVIAVRQQIMCAAACWWRVYCTSGKYSHTGKRKTHLVKYKAASLLAAEFIPYWRSICAFVVYMNVTHPHARLYMKGCVYMVAQGVHMPPRHLMRSYIHIVCWLPQITLLN